MSILSGHRKKKSGKESVETGPISFEAKVIDPEGIHARPASFFVATATKFNSKIKLVNEAGKECDLKSILSVLSAGVTNNSTFKVIAEGPDAKAALAAIKEEMIKRKLIKADVDIPNSAAK